MFKLVLGDTLGPHEVKGVGRGQLLMAIAPPAGYLSQGGLQFDWTRD